MPMPEEAIDIGIEEECNQWHGGKFEGVAGAKGVSEKYEAGNGGIPAKLKEKKNEGAPMCSRNEKEGIGGDHACQGDGRYEGPWGQTSYQALTY